MEENNGYGGAMGWFLVGGVTGACAALLLAPFTGKKTRQQLARKFRDTKESVTDFTDDLADTTRQITDKASRIGEKAVRLAADASSAAREVIGSLSDQSDHHRVGKR